MKLVAVVAVCAFATPALADPPAFTVGVVGIAGDQKIGLYGKFALGSLGAVASYRVKPSVYILGQFAKTLLAESIDDSLYSDGSVWRALVGVGWERWNDDTSVGIQAWLGYQHARSFYTDDLDFDGNSKSLESKGTIPFMLRVPLRYRVDPNAALELAPELVVGPHVGGIGLSAGVTVTL